MADSIIIGECYHITKMWQTVLLLGSAITYIRRITRGNQ